MIWILCCIQFYFVSILLVSELHDLLHHQALFLIFIHFHFVCTLIETNFVVVYLPSLSRSPSFDFYNFILNLLVAILIHEFVKRGLAKASYHT